MIADLSVLRNGKTSRVSSWDASGRNHDAWRIEPGETRVLADIKGTGAITHIRMTQRNHYRECLLKFTWDDAKKPSVLVPLGDFFGLGHGMVNSYQTSCVFHPENPVRFNKEIKVTIEHGHGNHLANDMSSVAYWYAEKPAAACGVPPVNKRLPVLKDNKGNWPYGKRNQCRGRMCR